MNIVTCEKQDGRPGKFEFDLVDPLVAVMRAQPMMDVLAPSIPRIDAIVGLNRKMRTWCGERNIRIRHYYEEINLLSHGGVMMALHFETPTDAILFKLSWVGA